MGRGTGRHYARDLQATIEMIAEHPGMGQQDDSLRSGYRRCATGSHVVFYRVGAKVEIIRVLHQSMDARAYLG